MNTKNHLLPIQAYNQRSAPSGNMNFLREVARIAFSNLDLAKKVFLAFLLVTLIASFWPVSWWALSSQVVVLSKKVDQGSPDESAGILTARYLPPSLQDLETESNIIRSRQLIRKTVKQLYEEQRFYLEPNLLQLYFIKPVKHYLVAPFKEHVISPLKRLLGLDTTEEDTTIDELTDYVVEELSTEIAPGSNVIQVFFWFKNPQMGQDFLNTLLHNYLLERRTLLLGEGEEGFFEQKKALFRSRLEELENEKITKLAQYGVSNPEQELNLVIEELSAEKRKLYTLEDDRLVKIRWLDYLTKAYRELSDHSKSFTYNIPYSFINDREITDQVNRLTEALSSYKDGSYEYRSGSARQDQALARLNREKNALETLLKNRVREREETLNIIDEQIQDIQSRIELLNQRSTLLNQMKSEMFRLQTEVEAVRDSYFAYSRKYEEVKAEDNANKATLSNVKILDEARVPLKPVFPRPGLMIPLGVITGLMLAFVAAFIREFFNNTFKYPDQITETLGLPVIAYITEPVEPIRWNFMKPIINTGSVRRSDSD